MSGIITSQDWLRRLRSSDNYDGIDIVVDDSSAEYPNRKWIMPEDLTKAILKRLVQVRDDAPLIVSYSWTENVRSKWAVGNVNRMVAHTTVSIYALDFNEMTHSDGLSVCDFAVCGPCVGS